MRSRTIAALSLALTLGCGGADGAAPAVPKAGTLKKGAAGSEARFGLPRAWPKSKLLPDVDPTKRSDLESAEGNLRLWGRMRVLSKPDGSVERAPDLLPVGRVSSIRLPSRLGGGFVFVSATGRGTELWRAASWLDPLVPLTSVGPAADMDRPLVAGFDRLYVRLRSGEILALDPTNGTPIGLGSLPAAPAYGEMVFLDGWRAVVDADLRGALATFDAGSTWRATPLAGRLRSIAPSERDPDDGGSALIGVDGGWHVLSPKGDVVHFRGQLPGAGAPAITFATPPGVRPSPQVLDPVDEGKRAKPGPLGRRPLRVALERGYPDTDKTAIVAHDGVLARVSLESGAILASHPNAYQEPHASCHGIALASETPTQRGKPGDPEIGFVCGVADGPTTIYALARDKQSLRPVMRFAEPRAVLESGQGGLVVRGTCTDEKAPSGVRPFCVRFTDGSTREVRVRGEVGSERVVALADGRVAIVVPPRPGTQGQLSILEGSRSKHVPLRVPDGAPREVETGIWLDGMQEVASGELGGWVEAGGPTFGIRLRLDGELSVGPVVNEPNGVLVSGRFGLAIGSDGKILESTDHGKTWSEATLPNAPEPDNPVNSRRCGPVGCALVGWLRVGWGEPQRENDLKEVAAPEPPKLSNFKLSGSPLSLRCERGRSEPKAKKAAARKVLGEAPTGWLPFRGVSPPALEKGEVGFDGGDSNAAWPLRAYVWGKRDSDWSRTGRFIVRFDDEFSLDSVRSSVPSASPWATEETAREMFGAGSWGTVWSSVRDPGGSATLAALCRARICALFSVEAGQPALHIRTSDPTGVVRPLAQSAVRVGPSWFYLGDEGVPDRIGLYRVDLGRSRQVALITRPTARSGQQASPRLVRRADGSGIGVMFITKDGPFDRRGTRWVAPVDLETGALGEPESLGRPDLSDLRVTAPCADEDGWLMELGSSDVGVDATLGGSRLMLEAFEVRARVKAGHACIDAGSGLVSGLSEAKGPKGDPSKHEGDGPKSGRGLSVFVTDRAGEGRSELVCRLGTGARF